MDQKSRFMFRGAKRNMVSFPLGGVGTGCLGLSGTGRLMDWEIFNRPSKGSLNGFSHFAVKAERDGAVCDARVLHADLPPPYTGNVLPGATFHGFGFGPERHLMSGVPHFRDNTFSGAFPFAQLDFEDDRFPGAVSLEAFNPFIPINDKDSGIPAAFFTVKIENTTQVRMDYTVCLSVANPYDRADRLNTYMERDGVCAMRLHQPGANSSGIRSGDMTFAVMNEPRVCRQSYWYRGAWFDNLSTFWREFVRPGPLKERIYGPDAPPTSVDEDVASLGVTVCVDPGEVRRVRFVLSWNHPINYNDWNAHPGAKNADGTYRTWKNYYAHLFEDSLSSATYALSNWDRLERESRLFCDALHGSSLPEEALDAVASNLSLLKSPTVLRLDDGTFYGWEGVMTDKGSCEGSCTHVWNYAYALPFLFPALERSMREADYRYNLREDGGMAFRLQLPLGTGISPFRPCVDGQMGGVIKTYREWKILGDTQWLRDLWPAVKKSLEYAWSPENPDRWDEQKTGVMRGRQHHTLDMELFGPSAWLNGFYLAALKAAAEMAEALGDTDADAYRSLFQQGKQWTDEQLFNGAYYFQLLDITDKGVLTRYEDDHTLIGDSIINAYWNDEAREIKYQIGEGCGIDQVLAQWHANLCGLGEVLAPAQVRSALAAIYRYNYKPSLREHFNPCRIYGLNDESGAIICEWPEGKKKPAIPVPYSEECMHGFEYQAAIHMIQEGLEKEGLDIVRGVRDRYDGEKRNPYNEMECGSNYARSMASYALLLCYSGFQYDMTRLEIGFSPLRDGRYFWSLDKAWGVFERRERRDTLSVCYGEQAIRRLALAGRPVHTVRHAEKAISFHYIEGVIVFDDTILVKAGEALFIE